jgi:hypothetical protein
MKQKLKYNLKFDLELIVNVDYFNVGILYCFFVKSHHHFVMT